MTHVLHSIVIQRTPSDVFDFVTNFENDKYWWKAVIQTEKTTPGAMRAGTEFRQTSKVLGITIHSHLKVLEYARPDHVRYVNESPQLPFSLLYSFTPTGSGATTFTLDAELDQKGLLRLITPLLLWSLGRQLNTYFGLLKTHMEAQPQ